MPQTLIWLTCKIWSFREHSTAVSYRNSVADVHFVQDQSMTPRCVCRSKNDHWKTDHHFYRNFLLSIYIKKKIWTIKRYAFSLLFCSMSASSCRINRAIDEFYYLLWVSSTSPIITNVIIERKEIYSVYAIEAKIGEMVNKNPLLDQRLTNTEIPNHGIFSKLNMFNWKLRILTTRNVSTWTGWEYIIWGRFVPLHRSVQFGMHNKYARKSEATMLFNRMAGKQFLVNWIWWKRFGYANNEWISIHFNVWCLCKIT